MRNRRCSNGAWILSLFVLVWQSLSFNAYEVESKHANVNIQHTFPNYSDHNDTNQIRAALLVVCDVHEYPFNNYCCKYCPAGTYVHQGCRTPHTVGDCHVCTNGKDYLEYASGLNRCLPCTLCRQDQEVVFPCTVAKDTICQCKPGTFCLPNLACEVCKMCTKRCADDMVIVMACNATVDSVCGLPPTTPDSSSPEIKYIIFACLLFIVGLVITVISWHCKKKHFCQTENRRAEEDALQSMVIEVPLLQNDNEITESRARCDGKGLNLPIAPLPEDHPCVSHKTYPVPNDATAYGLLSVCEENPQKHQPAVSPGEEALNSVSSSVVENKELEFLLKCNKQFLKEVKDNPQTALTSSFYFFISEVPIKEWKMFMRGLKLKENDIDAAVYNNDKDILEQHYQMLQIWQNKCGKDAAIYVLLQALLDIGLKGCAENIVNTLISNHIYKYNDVG